MTEFERVAKIFANLDSTQVGQNFLKHLDCFTYFDNKNLHSGWERWLQYEMLYLLTNDSNAKLRTPKFEQTYNYDKRIDLPKGLDDRVRLKIDFMYETVGKNTGAYHAIELKMRTRMGSAIELGLKDLFRMRAIKMTDWKFRSITAFSIFIDEPQKSSKYVELKNQLMKEDYFKIIKLTDKYKVLLFGWEARPSLAKREAYHEWCGAVDAVCKLCKVNVWNEVVS